MELASIIQDRKELQTQKSVRKVLLICGILSSLIYVGADIIAAMLYEGYSYTSQAISELSAIGAPTRPLLILTGTAYLFLVIAFGLGVWNSAGNKGSLRITGVMPVVYGLIGFAWPFASMHPRDVLAAGGGTLSDTTHLILSAVDSLLYLLIIGFGSGAFGRLFQLYSIATIIILLVFGALTAMDAPRIAANEPTPWIGVTERIILYGAMLWILVLSIMLLHEENRQGAFK